MTLFVDSSALVKRYLEEAGTATVLSAMASDASWIASDVARAETELTLCHANLAADTITELRAQLEQDIQRFQILPVDQTCLARTAQIGCEHRVRTLDAMHLAAADRLPRPFTFLTFDRRQADVARALGIDVVGVPES